MTQELPDAPIQVAGFPACRVCGREEMERGIGCAMHGGRPLDLAALRRSMLRQVRTAIQQMIDCQERGFRSVTDVCCPMCSWLRGAAMGIAGIAEQLGFESDMLPYMAVIGTLDPGWADRYLRKPE